MTGAGVPDHSGAHGSRRARDRVEAGGRLALGFDARPVVTVPAATAAAAAVFPRREILNLDVDRRGAVPRRVLHTLLFAPVVLAFGQLFSPSSESWRALARIGIPNEVWVFIPLFVVLLFIAIYIVTIDEGSAVAWEMFAFGGVVALVEILRTEPRGMAILLACGTLWVTAYYWRKLRITRRVRWVRLGQVVDDHRLVEAEIVRHRWHSTSGSSSVHTLRLVLTVPELPGQRWDVQLSPSGRQLDVAPETGDRVLMFVCPSDPGVAVVRPVLPA